MAIRNPRPTKLIVLKVIYQGGKDSTTFLFPLNPTEFQVNQATRISAVFTYGAKVFQNLGAGLKTITISGHTGYRLDRRTYGLQETGTLFSDLQMIGDKEEPVIDGKMTFLDLYSIIQLIKGENKYIKGSDVEQQIESQFSVENLSRIQNVQLIIPDQAIAYDVFLQNDQFMRSKDQPHLYKYSISFIVANETFGKFGTADIVSPTTEIEKAQDRISTYQQILNTLDQKNIQELKSRLINSPVISSALKAYGLLTSSVSALINNGNGLIKEVNSTLNDVRRLERLNDVIKGISNAISNLRLSYDLFKSFADASAFYETKIYAKQSIAQANLLLNAVSTEKDNLAFKFSLTRLASISAPVSLSPDKAIVALIQKDIRKLKTSGFVIPISDVFEVSSSRKSGKNIVMNFSSSISAAGITDIRIYSLTDYEKSNNLVAQLTDRQLIIEDSFANLGTVFNIEIEYSYKTFEQVQQYNYKSIRRVKILDGDVFDDLLSKYCPNEIASIPTYASQVAYLNNIEFPYIVTRSSDNYVAYRGSYSYKVFSTNGEFVQYINNVITSGPGSTPGPDLPLYEYANVSSNFMIKETAITNILATTGYKFFVILFKETYSNRLYALFGIYTATAGSIGRLFEADKYILCALERGKSYDIELDVIFEILSPYTINGDLVELYAQTDYANSLVETDIFAKDKLIIQNIYKIFVGSFSQYSFVFTSADKVFLSGDATNRYYVVLTNFNLSNSFLLIAYNKYRILTDGEFILLPSLSGSHLSFEDARKKADVYKIDLDVNFIEHEISRVPIPGVVLGELDFKLINGIANVKQAIKNRLECPKGGLKLHPEYGLPDLLGQKNTIENLTLSKYNIFEQLSAENRIKSITGINSTAENDNSKANVSIILVNNDEINI